MSNIKTLCIVFNPKCSYKIVAGHFPNFFYSQRPTTGSCPRIKNGHQLLDAADIRRQIKNMFIVVTL